MDTPGINDADSIAAVHAAWAASVPGAKNAAQSEEKAGAIDHGPLPADVMSEIEVILQRPPEGAPRDR